MISGGDIYKIISAMAPLYLALALGYGSVKWWAIITPQNSESINKLVYFFTIPFFLFDFISGVNPYQLSWKFIGADAFSKGIIFVLLAFWTRFYCHKLGFFAIDWAISSFSLTTMNNTLIIGVPLLRAMYGDEGVNLVLQSSAAQCLVWLNIILLALEVRRSRREGNVTEAEPSLWTLLKTVSVKVARNPNFYACIFGLIWALIANRFHIKLPIIVQGPVTIMSQAGTCTSMFSLGIFMAFQEKILSCGVPLTILGMVLRFIAGPASMAIGGLVVGLRGDVLCIAIIQAALPQAISSFIFAKEYNLHAQVISTAVIFGTIASLPILIGYFAVLKLIH